MLSAQPSTFFFSLVNKIFTHTDTAKIIKKQQNCSIEPGIFAFRLEEIRLRRDGLFWSALIATNLHPRWPPLIYNAVKGCSLVTYPSHTRSFTSCRGNGTFHRGINCPPQPVHKLITEIEKQMRLSLIALAGKRERMRAVVVVEQLRSFVL